MKFPHGGELAFRTVKAALEHFFSVSSHRSIQRASRSDRLRQLLLKAASVLGARSKMPTSRPFQIGLDDKLIFHSLNQWVMNDG